MQQTNIAHLPTQEPRHRRQTDDHLIAKWGYLPETAPPYIVEMAQQSQRFCTQRVGQIVSDELQLAPPEKVEELISTRPSNMPILEYLAQRIEGLRSEIQYILALQNTMPYYRQITLQPHHALNEATIKRACTTLEAVLTLTPSKEPCLIFASVEAAKEYASQGRGHADPIQQHFGRKPIPAVAPRSEVSKHLEIEFTNRAGDLAITCVTPTSAETPEQRQLIQIIEQAIIVNASNIAIQPELDGMTIVRFRIHGNMITQPMRLSPIIASEFAATLHQWASATYLSTHEKVQGQLQGPADGSFTFRSSEHEVFVRASFTKPDSLGGAYLECISLRLMIRTSLQPRLKDLNIHPDVVDAIDDAVREQNGIVLLVGATSSGKSTTIHGAIERYLAINGTTKNCLSVEDPVERLAQGLISHSITKHYGFDHMMAALLRQDPDAIFIGEIRDRNSASIAVRAANSGHLVFSSLHANNTASAIGALRAYIANRIAESATSVMVSDFDLIQSLNLIVAQQLVPHLCPNCRQHTTREEINEFTVRYDRFLKKHNHYPKDEDAKKELQQRLSNTLINSYRANPTGCNHPGCQNGEIGSLPINEYLAPSAECKQMLINMLAAGRIDFAKIESYRGKTMLDAAIERVQAGETSYQSLYI